MSNNIIFDKVLLKKQNHLIPNNKSLVGMDDEYMMRKDISAVVLAGGNSKRMGQNKALLKLGERTMIEVIVENLKPLFSEIIVVTNNSEQYPMLKGVRFAPDRIQMVEKNSLIGLYTGLWEAKNDCIFVVACDMPLLNTALMQYMIENLEGEDILIPYLEGHYQPLHAIYGKKCLEPMEMLLEKGDYKILNFFEKVVVKHIDEAHVKRFDPYLQSFLNVNNHKEYQDLKERCFDEKSEG
ncbi:Molybdopterin-guanine dinucleotide biosynthesis protein A-like protein [Alkaliphilus metalliredigens QYMF]|uniref:Probable molybdenum cofactor guanylyltransferase n=1 Tax=Alkaliphilus metalliredigens (strain QYMF) TaxID=293826 RepID=A6TLY8_ALKMQ|nr:molybdenum cofactor guanylyltransferase [Alkaliphilus metalliredigens]ABR47206.1 Molybdopterin-guanine dinucleotide biosynthesis protein A-like protein [Alkaliphilus metalliredigens QYMF]